jgi:hypothetical protein
VTDGFCRRTQFHGDNCRVFCANIHYRKVESKFLCYAENNLERKNIQVPSHSVVSIFSSTLLINKVTTYLPLDSREGQEILLLSTASRPALGPTKPSIQ